MLTTINSSERVALIAIDWGKTRAKLYLLSAQGHILASPSAPIGIQHVAGKQFLQALLAHFGDWLDAYPTQPIIACGMIGSREGLRETSFASTPTDPASLAKKAVRIDDLAHRPFILVPGICDNPQGGLPDVIRGMETRILGAMDAGKNQDQIFILPGTHSKWVLVKNGSIQTFRTYMTGELFSILPQHSVLGRLIPPDSSTTVQGFETGLAKIRQQPAHLANILFSVRTRGLAGQIAGSDLLGYLSGLLIGDEVLDGLAWTGNRPITLIGSSELVPLYQTALASHDRQVETLSNDIVAQGLFLLAREINRTE